MIVVLMLFLTACDGKSLQVAVSKAEARTFWKSSLKPENVLDGDITTEYHSSLIGNPEWLKLTLARKTNVEKVVIVNR